MAAIRGGYDYPNAESLDARWRGFSQLWRARRISVGVEFDTSHTSSPSDRGQNSSRAACGDQDELSPNSRAEFETRVRYLPLAYNLSKSVMTLLLDLLR